MFAPKLDVPAPTHRVRLEALLTVLHGEWETSRKLRTAPMGQLLGHSPLKDGELAALLAYSAARVLVNSGEMVYVGQGKGTRTMFAVNGHLWPYRLTCYRDGRQYVYGDKHAGHLVLAVERSRFKVLGWRKPVSGR